MRETAPLWKFGEVNPATPEFKELSEGEVVSFMPLEAVWPGNRVDYSARLSWSSKQSYTQFRKGDILIPKITPTFEAGRTIITDISTDFGLASTEVHVVRARDNVDSRYLQYCFQSGPFLDEGAHALQGVGNLRRISPRFVQELKVLDVDLACQQRIADYLEHETGKIDAMIAKMDQLAETLMLRRRSIVDLSFFKLREAPSTIMQMVADVTVGIVTEPAKLYVDEPSGIPALRGLNIGHGRVVSDNIVFISHEGHAANQKSALRSGDLVTVRTGRVGSTAVVPAEWDGANAIDLVITRPHRRSDSRFLFWLLESSGSRSQIEAQAVGSVQSHFNVGALKRLKVPVIALDEQQRIAAYLDEVTSKLDDMLAKVAGLRSLLIERRAALITDVVTGRKEVS